MSVRVAENPVRAEPVRIMGERGLFDARILVVDDTEFGRDLIAEIFRQHGFSQVVTAASGYAALELVRRDIPPDLIVLDLLMPGMDGFELCSILRRDNRFDDTVILMQTSSKETNNVAYAFQVGASDFLGKPLNPEELLVRASIHLERHFLTRSLQLYRDHMKRDLERARKMQDAILPSAQLLGEVEDYYGIGISTHFEPCAEIGGDFWGVRKLDYDTLAIYCADVAGHGIASTLNAFRLHVLMDQLWKGAERPSAYLARLNTALAEVLDTGQFVTMFYAVIHTADGLMDYASAGHVPPLVYHTKTGGVQLLEATGVPLGAVREAEYQQKTVLFTRRDAMLLYSDALLETPDAAGKYLPQEHVVDLLVAQHHQAAPNMLKSVLELFTPYRGNRPLPDDLTLNVVKFS